MSHEEYVPTTLSREEFTMMEQISMSTKVNDTLIIYMSKHLLKDLNNSILLKHTNIICRLASQLKNLAKGLSDGSTYF